MSLFDYGKGRATRLEFWVATLVFPLIYPIGISVPFDYWTKQFPYLLVFALAAGWLHFAIQRCHDRNISGWWCLLVFVPLVGQIWAMTQLGVREGVEGTNRFGPDPLAAMRARKPAEHRLPERLSPEEAERRRNEAIALHIKISALDTNTPDVNRLIEALRLFEQETGKDLKMRIDTVREPPLTILRRSEGTTSHNLIVEDGTYIDWIQDGPDRYDCRHTTLAEAVFEFGADTRTSMWAQEFRRSSGFTQ